MLRKMNGVGIIGTILNIVNASILMFLVIIASLEPIKDGFEYSFDISVILISFLVLFTFVLFIKSVYHNIKLLIGKLDNRKDAIIFGFWTLSFIGSILLIFAEEKPLKETLTLNKNPESDLKRYYKLLEDGLITEEEFNKLVKSDII